MTADLPDRWEDEPWPLDDPVPAPGLNPTNWSDTHDEPPQVADLADEAWEYAVDHGISMEQALVELQDRAVSGFHTGGTFSIGWAGGQQQVTVHYGDDLSDVYWIHSCGPTSVPSAWPDPDQHWVGFDLNAPAIGQDLDDFDPGDDA